MSRRNGPKADPKAIWYSKIDTLDRAAEVLRETSKAFLGLAALQLVLAIWLGPALVVDALINGILALLLMKSRSRLVACYTEPSDSVSISTPTGGMQVEIERYVFGRGRPWGRGFSSRGVPARRPSPDPSPPNKALQLTSVPAFRPPSGAPG